MPYDPEQDYKTVTNECLNSKHDDCRGELKVEFWDPNNNWYDWVNCECRCHTDAMDFGNVAKE